MQGPVWCRSLRLGQWDRLPQRQQPRARGWHSPSSRRKQPGAGRPTRAEALRGEFFHGKAVPWQHLNRLFSNQPPAVPLPHPESIPTQKGKKGKPANIETHNSNTAARAHPRHARGPVEPLLLPGSAAAPPRLPFPAPRPARQGERSGSRGTAAPADFIPSPGPTASHHKLSLFGHGLLIPQRIFNPPFLEGHLRAPSPARFQRAPGRAVPARAPPRGPDVRGGPGRPRRAVPGTGGSAGGQGRSPPPSERGGSRGRRRHGAARRQGGVLRSGQHADRHGGGGAARHRGGTALVPLPTRGPRSPRLPARRWRCRACPAPSRSLPLLTRSRGSLPGARRAAPQRPDARPRVPCR